MTKILNIRTGNFILLVTSASYDMRTYGRVKTGVRTLNIEESYQFEAYGRNAEESLNAMAKEWNLLPEELLLVND